MKHKIKSSKIPGWIKPRKIVGKTAIRNFTKQVLAEKKAWDERMAKATSAASRSDRPSGNPIEAMKGFKYDEEALPNSRNIEKAESMPEWIGGGVFDPRWNDVYLDLDPENPIPEPRPTAEELAERRAIVNKAGQEAADLLNRFYRLGKYASHR